MAPDHGGSGRTPAPQAHDQVLVTYPNTICPWPRCKMAVIWHGYEHRDVKVLVLAARMAGSKAGRGAATG